MEQLTEQDYYNSLCVRRDDVDGGKKKEMMKEERKMWNPE